MGQDAVLLHDLPHLLLGPVDHHAPMIDVTALAVRPMLLGLGIPAAGGALLPPLARQEQDALAPEALLVGEGDGRHVDLQVAAAPALAQARRARGERAAGAALAPPPARRADAAVQILEAH